MTTAVNSIEESVIQIISEVSGLPKTEIQLGSKLGEEIPLDSLEIIEIVMAIEEKYKMEIPDEETENLNTVKDIVDFVESNVTEQSLYQIRYCRYRGSL